MRISPFQDGYPIWTTLPTLRRSGNHAGGESRGDDAVQIV